jgi:flagellar motility protein MotE (MotC chaperone)
MKRLVNFRMNVDTHKALKILAAIDEKTLSDLLNEICDEHAKKYQGVIRFLKKE